jgi:hypothetical protein
MDRSRTEVAAQGSRAPPVIIIAAILHRDLGAMIPALGRAALAAKPQPYGWLEMVDYGAHGSNGWSDPIASVGLTCPRVFGPKIT